MSETDANYHLQCMADACKQGRCPCPCPDACWQPVTTYEAGEFLFICLVALAGVAGIAVTVFA